MSNTIAAGLKPALVRNGALQGFVDTLLPMAAFATNLSSDPMKKHQSVSVALTSSKSSKDFAQDYTATPDSTVTAVTVTLNKHKFTNVHMTDVEDATTALSLEELGYQAGAGLALDVMQDILSVLTLANYGAAIHTGPASTFDSDDVVDLRTGCNAAKIPQIGRVLALNTAYTAGLLKDSSIKHVANSGSADALRNGKLGMLSGFRTFESDAIPDNSENLVGFCGHSSGLALAMRYLMPQEGHTYTLAQALTDPESGLTMGVREWYDTNTGIRYMAFEAFYGYAVGNSAGLKRIVSA